MSIYQFTYSTGTIVPNVTLKWTTSTSTWADEGSDQPVYLTNNSTSGATTTFVSGVIAGDRIRGWKSNPITVQRGDFFHPSGNLDVVGTKIYSATDTFGSGPGSYWECVSIPSGMTLNSLNTGSATQNMDGSLSFLVNAGSDSSETYAISLNNVDKASIVPSGVGPWYHNYTYAQHTAIGYGTWRLYDQNGVLADISTTAPSATPPVVPPVTVSTTRKVFCNFW